MRKILAFAIALIAIAPPAFSQQLPPAGAGQVFGNSTAATRNGRPENVTDILDRALASTRGSIIRRGAAGWAAVVPSATVGLPWVSAGTGADPLYQALTVAGGGTGLTTLVIGDLLQASSTSALARLAAVSTGNVLISGGVGVVSSWGKVTSSHLNITTTSCTNQVMTALSATGTGTCSNVTPAMLPAGIDTNTLLTKTANYTIANTDCGSTIQLGTGSTGQFTVTLPAVAGFPTTCVISIKNGDTGRGKLLSGFPADFALGSGVLWPQQFGSVKIINGAWASGINPDRWAKANANFFVDTAGSDTNDGLATGAAAFRTLAKCANVAELYIDTQSGGNGGVTCSPTAGQTFQEFLQVFFPLTGGGSLIFQGNGGAFIWKPINSGSALQVGDLGVVGLTSVTFSSAGVTTPSSFVEGHNAGVIDVNTGVSLTPTVAIPYGFNCDYDTHFNINSGITINAGTFTQYIFHGCQNSTWNFNGTQTLVGTPVFNRYAVFDTGATGTFQGNVTFSGASTGSPMLVTSNAVVNNFTGGASYPGGTPITLKGGLICTAVGTCAANVVLTTDVLGALPVANGGTGDTGTAWTAYSPSVSCGVGTTTGVTATGSFKTIGKTTFVRMKAVMTTSTCASTVLGLPNTSQDYFIITGRETAVNGIGFICSSASSSSTCSMFGTSSGTGNTATSGAVYNFNGTYDSN